MSLPFVFSDCCDVAIEHVNCSALFGADLDLEFINSTCYYCPTFALADQPAENSTVSADNYTTIYPAEFDSTSTRIYSTPSPALTTDRYLTTSNNSGNTTLAFVATILQSSLDGTTEFPSILERINTSLVYNSTKHFVSPAQEYFL